MTRLSNRLSLSSSALLFFLAGGLAGGCGESSDASEAERSEPTSRASGERDPHAGLGPVQAPSFEHGEEAPAASLRGTVRETMNAAGYTYLRLETTEGASTWVAAMEMEVAVGDQVVVEGGNEMVDFHSRSLDRTFPSITFASSVRVSGAGAEASAPGHPSGAPAEGELPPGHPPLAEGAPSDAVHGGGEVAHGGGVAAEGGGARGVVRETMNAGGYTYLRIEGASGSVWVAVPAMTVAVGDEVEAAPGAEMPGFHSSTLDRTFEQITFSSGARVLPR